MKAFITVACILAGANSAPQFLARGAGQVSHQSVSKPFQGEHRSTVQSKAFGAGIASVSDAPNRLHGARGVIGHPVAHAVHAAPLLSHAPVVHAAPAFAHAPVVHAAHAIAHPVAAGYAAPDLAEVSPYSYNYAVADDYSGAAFNQAETNDGTGVVEGSYSVNLPDGRIQHVNYHANDYDGLISEVTYEGTAAYPEAVVSPCCPSSVSCHRSPCCPCCCSSSYTSCCSSSYTCCCSSSYTCCCSSSGSCSGPSLWTRCVPSFGIICFVVDIIYLFILTPFTRETIMNRQYYIYE